MSKALFFRGKWRRALKRKAKAAARNAVRKGVNNSKKRREQRRAQRAVQRERRRDRRVQRRLRREQRSFWGRHYRLANWRDAIAQRGHEFFDLRDLHHGIITQEEFDALDDFAGVEEWREAMRARRREAYRQQRARRRDEDYGPMILAFGKNKERVAVVKHSGFRPPPQRPTALKPVKPTWRAPTRRPVKRKTRVDDIVHQWRPDMERMAVKAMAADADLSGARDALMAFAESFPETRSQVHEHGGKMAAFGTAFAEAMDTFQATLLAGRGEESPGMPPEVVNKLKPLTDVGDQIVASCQEFIAAWEDYFQEAIKAAQDEHTPSKQKLTS